MNAEISSSHVRLSVLSVCLSVSRMNAETSETYKRWDLGNLLNAEISETKNAEISKTIVRMNAVSEAIN